ncbi:conserved hypothetical protein [uncultured Defluviicoccus sp.]|uniref:Uncharacterized protein n=1 Tax=metagenome TaxID=256318 RepID=A0A380TKF1_9ZZZZ|nr:conserved hypothetical protein [uncultured Defluviicoccus sp.]
MIGEIARALRTVSYLKWQQIGWLAYRRLRPLTPVKVKSSAPVLRRGGVGLLPRPCNARLGWDGGWTFEFVGVRRSFAPESLDWHPDDVSRLWRYNLHYFDFLLDDTCSVAARDALIDHWITANPPGSPEAWEPYPTSLRIVNWIDYFLRTDGARAPKEVWLKSLLHQAAWLARNVEYHILANHLFKNGVALLFAGVFFEGAEAERWLALGQRILEGEIEEQLLPDGGHFERSPMYHCIVTQDVLDVVNLLQATPAAPQNLRALIVAKARAAIAFLDGIIHPDGDIPLFNDSAFGIAPHPRALKTYAAAILWEGGVGMADERSLRVSAFADSGYFVCRHGQDHLIVDCGAIGPDYQPGHAHCDLLSFELSLNGERAIVDSGVSGYDGDPLRAFVRSTAAHNTVQVDGVEQSEMWGTFRVGRRARPLFARIEQRSDGEIVFEGTHDGYAHLPQRVIHYRRIVYRPADRLWTIIDQLEGDGEATIEAFLHIAPEWELTLHDGVFTAESSGGIVKVEIRPRGWDHVAVEGGHYCPQFSHACSNRVITLRQRSALLFEGVMTIAASAG